MHSHVPPLAHRDLKPANVLLSADGVPVIMVSAAAPTRTLCCYMAPDHRAAACVCACFMCGRGMRARVSECTGTVLWLCGHVCLRLTEPCGAPVRVEAWDSDAALDNGVVLYCDWVRTLALRGPLE